MRGNSWNLTLAGRMLSQLAIELGSRKSEEDMAPEVCVERQFRFHCSCGATMVSGEKAVTCTGCGALLGIRRVRRHRQQRQNSVAYYGSRIFRVRRVEVARAGLGIISRFGVWLKSTLLNCREIQKYSRVERQVQNAPEALGILHDIPEARRPLLVGVRVRVRGYRPDGKPHPHAGKTGRITKSANPFSQFDDLAPSAMVKLDSGIGSHRFIWVSNECLEVLPEEPLNADL